MCWAGGVGVLGKRGLCVYGGVFICLGWEVRGGQTVCRVQCLCVCICVWGYVCVCVYVFIAVVYACEGKRGWMSMGAGAGSQS